MSHHSLAVEILSDDDDDHHYHHHYQEEEEEEKENFLSPVNPIKKRRKEEAAEETVVILDDDPTPQKKPPTPSFLSTPSFVPDTPFSPLFNSDVSFVKCTNLTKLPSSSSSPPPIAVADRKLSGCSTLICLESDNESEGGNVRSSKDNENVAPGFGVGNVLQVEDKSFHGECSTTNEAPQVYHDSEEDNIMLEKVEDTLKKKDGSVKVNAGKKNKEEVEAKKRQMKEEKIRLAEERKLKREQEQLQKKALKAEAAEMKKLQKEQQKWEKGKLCLNSIIAEIDAKVVELGSIGGHLLSRFAEKGLSFRITSNPIERSILWKMTGPEQISEPSSREIGIQYVTLVYEADEFCKLVSKGSFMDHVSGVRSRYPSYTICYLTNKLMSYINRREQAQYKNPSNDHWRRPPVEEVLSKLAIDFAKVHSRLCRDEAELADHVVGLTSSLAKCQFRKKLTPLSVYANGAVVPKDFIDRNLIKKSLWLKALVAIPKVQPRFAIAISKKYPTMRSLLNVYMDPSKSVHEKEFLLKDLPTEGLLGNEDRRIGEMCSKRVYRILMAQNGNIKTDDVEDGADFF